MRTLSQGDHGTDVLFAQKVYNKISLQNGFSAYLEPDGQFGNKTKNAVKEFQSWYRQRYGAYSVKETGVIDGETWRALDALPGASHKMKLIPQYNNTTCWSACMSMLYGSAKCWDMPAGALDSDGALLDDPSALRAYASAMRRTLLPAPQSAAQLRNSVASRPIVMLGKSIRYKGGGHAVVISAVWSVKSGDEETAVIRILNPSPVNRGRVEGSSYQFMECENISFKPKYILV